MEPSKPRQITLSRKDRAEARSQGYIAIHEAGHAVAAVVLGVPLIDVNIIPQPYGKDEVAGGRALFVQMDRDELAKDSHQSLLRIAVNLAGGAAESELNPRIIEQETYYYDREEAQRIAFFLFGKPEPIGGGLYVTSEEEYARHEEKISTVLDYGSKLAFAIVDNYHDAIGEVARILIAKRSMTGDEVAEVVRRFPEVAGLTEYQPQNQP